MLCDAKTSKSEEQSDEPLGSGSSARALFECGFRVYDYRHQLGVSEPKIHLHTEPQKWRFLQEVFAMKEEHLNELIAVERKLNELLPHISKHRLEELKRLVANNFVKRFGHSYKIPKYGRTSKCFSDAQLKAFFDIAGKDSPKLALLFKLQAQLALRIGEAVKVSIKDIDFSTREILIRTEKAQILDTMILPLPLFNELIDYIKANTKEIESADGYIFVPDNKKTIRKNTYLSPHFVRNKFREYVAKACIDEVYGITDESDPNRKTRRLHRLTSHSLRHFGITTFSKQNNGNLVLSSRFARHKNPNTTLLYINTSKEELYSAIEKSGSLAEAIALKGRVK